MATFDCADVPDRDLAALCPPQMHLLCLSGLLYCWLFYEHIMWRHCWQPPKVVSIWIPVGIKVIVYTHRNGPALAADSPNFQTKVL
jgi:hypothetical protein